MGCCIVNLFHVTNVSFVKVQVFWHVNDFGGCRSVGDVTESDYLMQEKKKKC